MDRDAKSGSRVEANADMPRWRFGLKIARQARSFFKVKIPIRQKMSDIGTS